MSQQTTGSPRVGSGAGSRGNDLTGGAITPENSARQVIAQQLAIFERHCRDAATRVAAGASPLGPTVDYLYECALTCGLVDVVGDDKVQSIMADAFVRSRR
jgi:hypothetical protein